MLWGLLIIYIGLAFVTTVSIREAFWLSRNKRTALLALNWLLPIFGSAIALDSCDSPLSAGNNRSGHVGSTESTDIEPSSFGGGSD